MINCFEGFEQVDRSKNFFELNLNGRAFQQNLFPAKVDLDKFCY
jgi:hypothetical protein